MHDELGDDVSLTEEMTMTVLDTLARWKEEHGVAFDYYLVDCFWYARPGDYQKFNSETWPNGFEPARKRMEELGMKPGLWLDVTGGQVTGNEAWAGSLDAFNNHHYCLFDGPYGQGLLDAMMHAAEEWGVRMFKFDFANFYAVSARCRDLERGEVYAQNVSAFREICRSVKERHPDVLMLAYNGFIHLPGFLDNTTGAVLPGIDPAWLGVMDYLYSGDPRPADLPCTSLRRAVDMYQDHTVYKFHRSGIPLDRIDDHGCMVGGTNTAYYLGQRGWRRTWVQTLARGSRKAHFYGDVTLLEDDDVRFLKAARDLFFGLYSQDAETRLLGGVPCQSPLHGFQTGAASDGLLVLVNASPEPEDVYFPVAGLERASVLFHDEGHVPECEVSDGALSVRLAPEQMALVGLGEKADEQFQLGVNSGGDPVSPNARRLDLAFDGEHGDCECHTSGQYLASAAAHEQDLSVLRLSFRLRDGSSAARRTMDRGETVSDALRIEVRADRRTVAPLALVPGVKVWSGCSWVTGLYSLSELTGADEVLIRFHCPDAEPRIIPQALLQAT